MPNIICKIIANYLIMRIFIGGGVFVLHDVVAAPDVQFTALQYVAQKFFIAQKSLDLQLQN